MPSLGADMETGTVVDWLVKPGDKVKRGDVVAVVDTQKAAIEVEIFSEGTIDQIVVPAGQKVPVGAILATLHGEGETPSAPVALGAGEGPSAKRIAQPLTVSPGPAAVTVAQGHRSRVSPLARRLAEELHVDISQVTGTGPEGAITKADIEQAAAKPKAPAAPLATDRQLAMREAIGQLMARSKREIPHYYLGTQIDLSTALAWLEEQNLKRTVTERLLSSLLLIKAAALAIHEVPEMNGFWTDGKFQASKGIHPGIAISLRQGGLIAPAIHDADQKSLDELMASLRDLVQRTRTGMLRASEMSDPTITITNLGDRGVETVFGVIYPPQVALVGFGKVVERPWAVDGMIGARPVVTATLAADHRVSDGHRGGLFLAAIDRLLQEPEKL